MDIFELMKKEGHEQIIFNYDKETGMRAIIAIHNTTLGQACGGTRMGKQKFPLKSLSKYVLTFKRRSFK